MSAARSWLARASATRNRECLDILPREGPGDFRPGTAVDTRGLNGRAHEGAQYHNPVRVAKPMDHRTREAARYIARRNGLPEDVPYEYRAGAWQERCKRAGLDLDAIAAADRELSRPVTKSL